MNPRSKGTDSPIWIYPKQDPAWIKEIVDEFNIHPVTAQVIASRRFDDLDEIHDFLYAKLPELHDPDLFLDMDKAVHRVLKALEDKEKILIYGDNDVDGITGTTLLTEFFEYLGVPVFSYISNRIALNQKLNPRRSLLCNLARMLPFNHRRLRNYSCQRNKRCRRPQNRYHRHRPP